MYIILLRHGETDFNKLEKVQGSEVDPPLNQLGQKQAELTGEFIKNNFKIDVIYCSKYLRAKQTAVKIMNKINYKKKIVLEDDLKEGDKGLYSGKSKEEVKKLISQNEKLKKFNEDCNSYDHYQKLNTMYENDHISKLMKKETNKDVGVRAKKTIRKIMKQNLNKNILIVTHGSFIANAIRNIFKLRQIPEQTVGKGNCSITVIKLEKDQKELIMGFNNMHLKELY